MWSLSKFATNQPGRRLWRWLAWRERPWGAWALVNLLLSLLSGLVVGLQYEYSTPFFSVSAIDLLIPYGGFFRALHFYSSQLFFFAGCVHLLAVYRKSGDSPRSEWWKLIAALVVSLLLLFTGYVLRGDNTGVSAGVIAEHILVALPLLGEPLNNLLFAIDDSGLRKVYLQHVIGLDFLLLLLLWQHLRRYRVRLRDNTGTVAIVLLFSMLVAAPLEPARPGVEYISGPWFFLGLQELLRYLSPLTAGVGIPSLFLVALFLAQPGGRRQRLCLWGIGLWLGWYAVFTLIAWNR